MNAHEGDYEHHQPNRNQLECNGDPPLNVASGWVDERDTVCDPVGSRHASHHDDLEQSVCSLVSVLSSPKESGRTQ